MNARQFRNPRRSSVDVHEMDDSQFLAYIVRLKRNQSIESLLRPTGLQPSRPKLTTVCGPAGAGKSTYVAANASAGDIIIDMDMIRAELGIAPSTWDTSALSQCLERRNAMLRSLATSSAPAAWFIVSAPSAAERAWWRDALQPRAVVVVLASAHTCIERINATRKGNHADRSIRVAKEWWARYETAMDDVLIRTDAP